MVALSCSFKCRFIMPRPHRVGIMHCWLLSIRLMPDSKVRTAERRKLKIGWKEARDPDDTWPNLEAERSNTFQEGEFWRRTACVFYRDINDQWTISVLWPSSWKLWWLFKSSLGGAGGILCQPHYRPLSLLYLTKMQKNNSNKLSYMYVKSQELQVISVFQVHMIFYITRYMTLATMALAVKESHIC